MKKMNPEAIDNAIGVMMLLFFFFGACFFLLYSIIIAPDLGEKLKKMFKK